MAHDHSHDHHHSISPEQARSKAFVTGIGLNLLFVMAELFTGISTNSLALISDAGHNFSDVISLALSLLAFRLAKVKPSKTYTYGYKKTTILAALTNATVLLIAIGILGYESILRIKHPVPVQGGVIAWMAALGIVINSISAFVFFKNRHAELNAKAAYLHLLADALVSVGVVLAGLVIKFTGWYFLDPIISLALLIVILVGTWSLLGESLRLSLDAVPKGIDLTQIEKTIKKVSGVDHVHHIHIWAMSTTENALTAQILLNEKLSFSEKQKVIRDVKHELLHQNIHHATLEMEQTINEDHPC